MTSQHGVDPEDCPNPVYHEMFRYCPSCTFSNPPPPPDPDSFRPIYPVLTGPEQTQRHDVLLDDLNHVYRRVTFATMSGPVLAFARASMAGGRYESADVAWPCRLLYREPQQ